MTISRLPSRGRLPRLFRGALALTWRALPLWFALACSSLGAQSATSTGADPLLRPADGEWRNHGRTYDNQRYSPLTEIDRTNVARLGLAGIFQLNVDRAHGLETTPIVADGVMYVTTSYDNVLAFDLRTRKRLWQYEHKLGTAIFCCGPVNRGVAVARGRVFLATLDAHLVALDAATGSVAWDVVTHPADSGYAHTEAPLVVDDKVIVGVAGGEYGIRGSVSAYDASSGALVWRWYAIPSPEEGGWWGKWRTTTSSGEKLPRDIAAEKRDSAKFADAWQQGGAPVWTTPAYDPALKLIFFGVGNPSPSNDGELRPGDNLYNNSTVALDAQTGKLRWYDQHVPHDLWDYDTPNPPVLARVGGRTVVMHSGKIGWTYIYDAATGVMIRRSQAFVPQSNLFAAPNKEGVLVAPGPAGGANWPPSSWSPRTGLLYVSATDLPMIFTREPQEYKAGQLYIGGGMEPPKELVPRGTLSAIDPATGRIAWQVKHDTWLWGGTLATAGDLVFMGDPLGYLHAYDARTGRELWSFFCGAGVDAPPISYSLDGKQYIAVAAGGSRYGDLKGNAILLFALGGPGGGAVRPPTPASTAARPNVEAPLRSSGAYAEFSPLPGTRVGEFMSYDSASKVVHLRMIGGMGGVQGGMSFNGKHDGGATVSIPVGWSVQLQFSNADKVPHSVLVIRDSLPLPAAPATPAIPGAIGTRVASGITARDAADNLRFTVREPGRYLIVCGVPGHAASGMWIRLVVEGGLVRPGYR